MINIAISRYTKDTSIYIYKKIQEDLEKEERSFLIVPEQYTLQSDIDFMDHIKYSTVIDAKILSFNSLSKYIIEKIGKSIEEPLTNTGKIILLTKIMSELNNDLELFKNSYKNIEFVENISMLISNIKDYNFDDEFFESIENSNLDQMLKIKFRDIKIIYDRYKKDTENIYEDSEDRLNYVISQIKKCDFLKGTNFYFDKFDSMSDLRINFIKALIDLGCKVSFGLTFDYRYFNNPHSYDISIYDEAKNFIEKLKKISEVNIIKLEEKNDKKTDINHLLDNFETYNPKKFKNPIENIFILQSTSTTSEVENIALMLKKNIKNGKRYKDFSIIITDQSQYKNQIIRIFDRYNIAYFLDETRKLYDNNIIKTWIKALRIIIYNFKKDDVLSFVRSGIYDFGENNYENSIVFQNYLENRKIKNKMILEDKYFTLDYDFYKNDKEKLDLKQKELDIVNLIRNKLINLISPLYNISKKPHKASIIVTEIFNLLDDEGFKRAIESYQEILTENNDLSIVEENQQVWDKFINILDQIVKIFKDTDISLEEIYKLIESAIKNINIGIIPPTKDHILITDFSRDRVSESKYKIILGMNDVYFPSSSKDDFLINNIEKDKLKEHKIDLKVYEIKKDDRELLNMLRMISSSEKIYFSYALSDKDNIAINKSITLVDIMKIFEKISVTDLSILGFDDKKYSKDILSKFVMERLWKLKRNEKISEKDEDIVKLFIEYSKSKNIFNIYEKGLLYTNDKKNLSDKNRLALYDKNRWNVSEMQTYAKCPHKYFYAHGIKPDQIEEYDVDFVEIGNIVHFNIENFTRKIKDLDINSIGESEIEKLMHEDFESALEKYIDKTRKQDPKNKYILGKIFDSSKKNSKEILKQLSKGEFRIENLEEKFAKNGLYPEVYVDNQNYIEGRIDRIDRHKDYVRIIDYKTGSKDIRIYNILEGLDIQLIIYMISTRKKKNNKSYETLIPVGAFYLPLKDELEKIKDQYDKDLINSSFENKFKMEGIIVKINDQIIKMMDRDFDKSSSVFSIRKAEENILSQKEDMIIEKYVKDMISKNIREIKNGNISLRPIKYGESFYECANCIYRPICKIDYSIDQQRFKELDKSKKIDDLIKGDDND